MYDAVPTGLFGKDVLVARSELAFSRAKWGQNVVYFSRWRDTSIQSFNRGLEDIMAASKNLKQKLGVGKDKKQEFEWKGFINVSLSPSDKEAYAAWDIQDADVWDGLATYAQSGYKINLSFNRQNDKFVVTFTGQPESGSNSGYAVSAHANSPYNAARVGLFKVSTLLPEDWTEYVSPDIDEIG